MNGQQTTMNGFIKVYKENRKGKKKKKRNFMSLTSLFKQQRISENHAAVLEIEPATLACKSHILIARLCPPLGK